MGSHDNAITAVAVSPNGRHVVAIMDNGSINVYCAQSLTQELNKVMVDNIFDLLFYYTFFISRDVFLPPKPPPSQVAVVSDGTADQDLSNLKVKVRSVVTHRPAKTSGRQTQAKTLRPHAGSRAEDKEVESTYTHIVSL